jgi:hypothetical protein
MQNANVEDITTTVARPATTFTTIPVTFDTWEWPIIVEAKAKGTWTAHDAEKRVECIIAMRRHADGRALLSYQFFENETPLSSWGLMAMPKTTDDAIDWICAHLLANASGFWRPLVASFREKYTASPAMKDGDIIYRGYNVHTYVLKSGLCLREVRRPHPVSSET